MKMGQEILNFFYGNQQKKTAVGRFFTLGGNDRLGIDTNLFIPFSLPFKSNNPSIKAKGYHPYRFTLLPGWNLVPR